MRPLWPHACWAASRNDLSLAGSKYLVKDFNTLDKSGSLAGNGSSTVQMGCLPQKDPVSNLPNNLVTIVLMDGYGQKMRKSVLVLRL